MESIIQQNKDGGKKRQKSYYGGSAHKKIWQDKREKKKQKIEDQKKKDQALEQNDHNKIEVYELREYSTESPKFDEYYSKIFEDIMNEDQFKHFKQVLIEKLPVTFRVNPGVIGHEKIVAMFKDPLFIQKYSTQQEINADNQNKDEIKMGQSDHLYKQQLKNLNLDFDKIKIDCKEFYPQNLVFELMMPKEMLKKHEGLKQIHQIIDASKDAGLITRQEIVSMIPPILCDIQSHHSVFDMCAAPGSKTAQILELILNDHLNVNHQPNSIAAKGFVVANDADHKRAYLLTHQINRFNTSNTLITNHNAQEYPSLFYQRKQLQFKENGDNRFLFDRIICDVPCSSDAAIRKIPQKWSSWSPRESQTLHPLQIKICQRGLELLKVGGKLSYSTCSLNPIENEAVVAALLKMYGNKIRLLETGLNGFKFQAGLKKWRFLTQKQKNNQSTQQKDESFFEEYENFIQVPDESIKQGSSYKIIRETMFSSYYDENIKNELSKCMRVMPHYQNTSGFFITIIQKVEEFDKPQFQELDPIPVEKDDLPQTIQQLSKSKAFEFVRGDSKDPDIQYIKSYFGLTENFPYEQLVSQDQSFKKIYFISKEVSDFLYTDCFKHQMDLISLGVHLFQRNNSKYSGTECIYRVVQDGIINLIPYMTKRIVRTKNIDVLKKLIMYRYNDFTIENLFNDKDLYDQINEFHLGCFVIVIDLPNGNLEALTMHKFQNALSTMIGKEAAQNLQFRHLNHEERQQSKFFDQTSQVNQKDGALNFK